VSQDRVLSSFSGWAGTFTATSTGAPCTVTFGLAQTVANAASLSPGLNTLYQGAIQIGSSAGSATFALGASVSVVSGALSFTAFGGGTALLSMGASDIVLNNSTLSIGGANGIVVSTTTGLIIGGSNSTLGLLGCSISDQVWSGSDFGTYSTSQNLI
jgi:hypothetical protein